MFQFSYEYLRQLRNGIYSFKLIKGEDWYWQDGKIIYTQSAVDKLTLRAKGAKCRNIKSPIKTQVAGTHRKRGSSN